MSRVRDHAIVAALGVALIGSAWLLDPTAQAGFDAPKRFAVLVAAASGLVALAWPLTVPAWHAWSRLARLAAGCAALAAFGCIVATFTAAQPADAWDALRTLALYAVFVPLGASRALDAHGRRVACIAVAAIGVNAVLSLVQAAGVALPIPLAQLGGRYPTGALLGNEAYVAIACALLGAASSAVALHATTWRLRFGASALIVLALAAIATNRQITAAAALAGGIAATVAVRFGARRLVRIGAAIVALAFATAAVPALRSVTWSQLPYTVEMYQQATTYRLGAWAAAEEMIAARPWTGYGPGSYAAQTQSHRLAAERHLRERLIPPPPSSAFVYAHQDYLQFAAETGVPALFAALAALALVLGGLLRIATTREPLALLGVLVAGTVAALAWFPLQIPLIAVLLLVACGRAWRLVADAREGDA